MKKLIKTFLPEFVYGGIDGLVTTFAIVTAAVGASLSPGVILVLGLANVLADAFSMGSSNYLASHSEQNLSGDKNHKQPLHTALVTFGSFVIIGLVPVVPFVLRLFINISYNYTVGLSVGATMFMFLVVGYVEGSVTKSGRLKSALRTFLVGAVAAFIAFGVGWLLKDLQ